VLFILVQIVLIVSCRRPLHFYGFIIEFGEFDRVEGLFRGVLGLGSGLFLIVLGSVG